MPLRCALWPLQPTAQVHRHLWLALQPWWTQQHLPGPHQPPCGMALQVEMQTACLQGMEAPSLLPGMLPWTCSLAWPSTNGASGPPGPGPEEVTSWPARLHTKTSRALPPSHQPQCLPLPALCRGQQAARCLCLSEQPMRQACGAPGWCLTAHEHCAMLNQTPTAPWKMFQVWCVLPCRGIQTLQCTITVNIKWGLFA